MVINKVYVKKLIGYGLFQPILWILLALLFLFIYPISPTAMAIIGGVFLLIQGIPLLYLFILEDERFVWSITILLDCIIISFLGVWLVSKPNALHQYLSFAFSVVMLLHGVVDTLLSIHLKKLLSNSWLFAIGVSSIKIVVAMVLLMQLHVSIQGVHVITSVCMILDGGLDIRLWTQLAKKIKENEEAK